MEYQLTTHQEKNNMAIPRRIFKNIHAVVKKERELKRSERLEKEKEIFKLIALLATNFCQRVNEVVAVNNDDFDVSKLLSLSKYNNDIKLSIMLDEDNMDVLDYKNINRSIVEKYQYDLVFRKNIRQLVMLYIIEKYQQLGPAYALLFGRVYNLSLDYVMQYGYGIPNGDILLDEYKKAGGCLAILCLPNYFTRHNKDCYNLDELDEMIKEKEEAKKMIKERRE